MIILKGIWYKTIQSEPPRIPWFCDSGLTRQQIVMALRLRSGHVPLNKFAFLMKKLNSPNCDLCGVEDDIHHFLVECTRNAAKRQELTRRFSLNLKDVGAFQSALSTPDSEIAKMIYQFKLK